MALALADYLKLPDTGLVRSKEAWAANGRDYSISQGWTDAAQLYTNALGYLSGSVLESPGGGWAYDPTIMAVALQRADQAADAAKMPAIAQGPTPANLVIPIPANQAMIAGSPNLGLFAAIAVGLILLYKSAKSGRRKRSKNRRRR